MVKNTPAHEGDMRDASPILGREDALGKEMTPTPVFSSGESHEQKRLAGYSPWGGKKPDTTETHTYTQQTQRTFIETTFL